MVEDAFGHCHRRSCVDIENSAAYSIGGGLYLEEVQTFEKLLESRSDRWFDSGGTKTYDKIMAIKNLIDRTDKVLIGGAAANNFLKAPGDGGWADVLDEPYVDKAKRKKSGFN